DEAIHERLLEQYLAAGDFEHAREMAATAPRLKRVADALDACGRHDEALQTLMAASALAPDDRALATELARILAARGDLTAAQLTVGDGDGADPDLLLTIAQLALQAGKIDDGCAMAARLLAVDKSRRDAIASVGLDLASASPDASLSVVGMVVDS